MKNVLLITTMYPDPLRPGTKVCHYFASEWVKMGFNVLVINYRSMFPFIYVWMAKLFPKLALRYVGNYVEMDTNKNVIQHECEGIPVYSIPIYKYIPHGKYPRSSINKQLKTIKTILQDRQFEPDAIVGHFYNPQMEIIAKLKNYFPKARTSLVLHEINVNVIKKNYPCNHMQLLNSIDVIGFRSNPIKRKFETLFGNKHNVFLCYSGVATSFFTTPFLCEKKFSDGTLSRFIYVGQFIARKYPRVVIEALCNVYKDDNYHLTYVGEKEICFESINTYVVENRITDKVTFTGQLDRSEIIKCYDNSECFIMISSGEVFGLVYLEAMARGCIVIAARDEGMDGIIEYGVNGYLCQAGDVQELSSIICNINNMTAKQKKVISDNARATAVRLSDYNVAKYYIERVLES